MKVLYIISNPFYYTHNPVGGSISSGTGVIQALNNKGYDIDILSDDNLPTIEPSESIKYIYFSNLVVRKIISSIKGLIPLRLHTLLSGIFFKISIRYTLPDLLTEEKYDLIYIRASHYAAHVLYHIKVANIPSILEVNKPLSMQPFNKKEGFLALDKAKVRKIKNEIRQYEYCTMISVDSSLRAQWIIDYVDKKFKNKILINHNGVNQDLFTSSVSKPNSNVVGMASSFRWYNDIDELMRIIRKVVLKKEDIIFKLFIGDLLKKVEIEQKISENNLTDFISLEFEIPLLKMPLVMSECDILISHFNFHGVWPHNCSIKHLEYMALSRPVVATRVGEVNFAIQDGHNGALVEEGDEEGFSQAILDFLNDKEYANQLGKNGRNDILEKHTWDKHVERSLQTLKSYETNK
tara:strand:+ start:9989 stop:11209 length:1221 start_codon:yes stop_codon:yes gene_type:complete